MFGPFVSVDKKARVNAVNWLELAQKVWHFRRDVLDRPLLQELEMRMAALQDLLRKPADADKLKSGIAALEETLRRAGGTLYPKSELVEWVEFLLVAAIVIIGVRTYFVQPFQIPTNSMWPSYYGMTAEVYPKRADEPGPVKAALRIMTAGARPDRIHRIDAPVDGEVLIPIGLLAGDGATVPYGQATGRSLYVFPEAQREYVLFVGGKPVPVRVPADFDLNRVICDAFFPGPGVPEEILGRQAQRGQMVETVVTNAAGGQQPMNLLHTGKMVRAGERMLSFDILAGDMLMVDRFSYHFVRPSVGDGFVFRTVNIHSRNMQERDARGYRTGVQIDNYYIKRLVGLPGDRLEIRQPVLYRNGAPIAGVVSFDKEAQQIERYPGYRNRKAGDTDQEYLIKPGDTLTVPPHSYFAMGDNSPNSADSRFWGFVPEMDVVGRPLFIYYPFARWFP
ncbi:MAG: signal peptidase I [Verrucomicrobiota bacterium]